MGVSLSAVPLQTWSGPEGSRKLRFPDFMTTAQDGGKVVSLTHRPPLPPGNTSGTHFCWRLSRPQGHSATGKIMSPQNSNDTIGNRTRDLHTQTHTHTHTHTHRIHSLRIHHNTVFSLTDNDVHCPYDSEHGRGGLVWVSTIASFLLTGKIGTDKAPHKLVTPKVIVRTEWSLDQTGLLKTTLHTKRAN